MPFLKLTDLHSNQVVVIDVEEIQTIHNPGDLAEPYSWIRLKTTTIQRVPVEENEFDQYEVSLSSAVKEPPIEIYHMLTVLGLTPDSVK